ncbi:outer membrane lipoprotein-sorting protein [Plasticicumulans acidivorans]|uniref:Outer membrane lipoprotein-sorting protein n=1 Tax=Plasticicumulans acidivorans TaxID=886464 RepID=A0A317MYU1_9GAMM|nr:outer membrane lipoprotein-sorting protein [Plasticicumulans acidivorans]PWV60681.1 outer membrane lipoprotein-sorting protein [Plasticicumulans acidivorans]
MFKSPNRWLLLAALTLLPSFCAIAQEVDIEAMAMLEAADRVRFPDESFELNVTITSTSADQPTEEREYQVLSKGNENTLVISTAPASERGQILLMRGRDLWVYTPRLSQPVRLPLSQRLTGQVANGDLARANFSGDYNARTLREETIDKKRLVVLELIGIDGGVTYNRVLYWIEKDTQRPFKAEFYALSGRLLKTAFYRGYKMINGVMRPTELLMRDALKKDDQSVLVYSAIKPRELANKLFNKDYLKRIKPGE